MKVETLTDEYGETGIVQDPAEYDRMCRAQHDAPEVCVRAATRVDGVLLVTDRHHQAMHVLASWGAPSRPITQADQGFITSRGRFVSREEGRHLQDSAGIASLARHGYIGRSLFSEDLY